MACAAARKCLEALCERYPEADIFTLFHVPGSVSDAIERHRIVTSSLQRLPFARTAVSSTTCRSIPAAIEQFDLDAYDLVVSSSHCAAKAVIVPGRAPAHLLLPFADAVCVGSVRRLLRTRAGRRVREPLGVSPDAEAAGALGCRDGVPRRTLCRELSIRCGQDPPIL